MNKSTNQAERARIGEFELNVRTGELFSIGRPAAEAGSARVLLREQPFQILRILVERHGTIVTRQEIRQLLWPDDTVVEFDRSINVAMAILRKALADDADHPKYIETLPRRGYRLIAPVEWQQSSTSAQDSLEPRADARPRVEDPIDEREPRGPQYSRTAVVLGASALVLALVGYLSWQRLQHGTPPQSKRIMLAVLPFANLTGDPTKEYLADGLTEETISQLSRLNPNQLGVIARTSIMGYKRKDERLDQIGHELSVEYVLENSLRQSRDVLRITSQLLLVKDQTHLWSHDYDYHAQDVLTVEDELAKAVAREIQVRLTMQQQAELAQPHLVNSEAFHAYLKGYYFFERNTDKDTQMAATYYERATQLDSSFALAWVGLSRARNWEANQGLIPVEEGRRLAREAIERALALNPNLAAAHAQMARIKRFVDLDWAGADASIQRATALEPGNPEYLASASFSAVQFGRADEALALARRAVELDPLNPGSWSNLGATQYYEGQLAGAEADVKKSLELSADVWPGPILLSEIYVMQGRLPDALQEIERVRFEWARRFLSAVTYGAMGREKQSDAALQELIANNSSRGAHLVAEVYAIRNERDAAFEWLDRAYAQREGGLAQANVEPFLKNLRSDPRFTVFLKKLNLPN